MSNIDNLKQQLEEKLEQEYRDFIEKITFKTKEEIIRNAYKLTVYEQVKIEITDRYLDRDELKALIEKDNVLEGCYDRWIDDDSKLQEAFEFIVDDEIEDITEEYNENKRQKHRESR